MGWLFLTFLSVGFLAGTIQDAFNSKRRGKLHAIPPIRVCPTDPIRV
ncbi:MAG: hypothetical protein HYY20_10825 [Candidatus Tectomicrobia bacterium]|uniref:Uncharacterized protein n=1 Tax=Tectimicrobiota bacterium TaxID=2528274 RepID=A0A932FZD4_UNCTE|nr:hypothetical protein [Candidatus Tectomicrobia bacterium]